MTRGVRHALTVGVLLAAFGVSPPVRAAGELNLDGMYVSQGTNPDGSKYSGLVNITRNGDSFLVSWLTPKSQDNRVLFQAASVGVGILSSDMLSVSYYAPQSSGIVVYRIEEDGSRLAGRWVIAGEDGAVHAEILTKLPVSTGLPEMVVPIQPEATPARPRPVDLPGLLAS